MLAGHFSHNEARATRIRRRTSFLVLTGATVAAGLLVTGCTGTISSAIKSAAPSVTLPSRPAGQSPAAAASPTAASSNPASSLLWLWILLGVLALLIIGYLIARSTRRGPKPADVWRSRSIDAYAKGSALYDAMRLAEAPGALVAADAAARWADIQRRADDLAQALYAMREAAPDEDKRMRTADVLASLQAVRSAMAAERGSDVSQVPPPELVSSRLASFGASLEELREPDDKMPY